MCMCLYHLLVLFRVCADTGISVKGQPQVLSICCFYGVLLLFKTRSLTVLELDEKTDQAVQGARLHLPSTGIGNIYHYSQARTFTVSAIFPALLYPAHGLLCVHFHFNKPQGSWSLSTPQQILLTSCVYIFLSL